MSNLLKGIDNVSIALADEHSSTIDSSHIRGIAFLKDSGNRIIRAHILYCEKPLLLS